MRLTAEASAVEPLFFAMVDGRDRICWRQDRANKFVESFLASRSDDPRLLPLADWQSIAPSSVFYATLIGEDHIINAMRSKLGSHLADCFTTVGPDGYDQNGLWLEVVSRHATKATAALGLKRERNANSLIVFGDNLNDVPLFEAADHSCAVANGVREVLNIADDVIDSNERDGVAKWLAQRLL